MRIVKTMEEWIKKWRNTRDELADVTQEDVMIDAQTRALGLDIVAAILVMAQAWEE